MRKKNIFCQWGSVLALAALAVFAMSACSGTENELLEGVTTEADAEDEEIIYTLSEEEMKENELYWQVSENFLIDAYFTPSTLYENGIAVWEAHRNVYEESDEETEETDWNNNYGYEDLDADESVLGVSTMGTVTEALDTLVAALGDVYVEEWENAKAGSMYRRTETTESKSFSCARTYRSIGIITTNYGETLRGAMTIDSGVLSTEEEELGFLSLETLKEAVVQAVNTIYPGVAAHYTLLCDSYNGACQFRFYSAIEGIPLKQAYVPRYIKIGQMSEDSFDYLEEYNDGSDDRNVYGSNFSREHVVALMNFSESGFYFDLKDDYTYTLFREAREVLDINDILPKVIRMVQLKYPEYDVTVKNIELVMAMTTAENGDGTYRVVYAPYWVADYTCDTGSETTQGQFVWEAYEGVYVNSDTKYTPIKLED